MMLPTSQHMSSRPSSVLIDKPRTDRTRSYTAYLNVELARFTGDDVTPACIAFACLYNLGQLDLHLILTGQFIRIISARTVLPSDLPSVVVLGI